MEQRWVRDRESVNSLESHLGPVRSWLVKVIIRTAEMLWVLSERRDNTGSSPGVKETLKQDAAQASGLLAEEKTRKEGKVSVFHSESMSCPRNTFQADTGVEDADKSFVLKYKCGRHWHVENLKTWK
jgi:hypothetical protein